MKKYISTRFGYELEEEQRADLIRTKGFDGVLLWMGDKKALASEKRVEMYQKAGLEIENIHAPVSGMNEFWKTETTGNQTLERLLQCVEICQAYQVNTMVLHLTRGSKWVEPAIYGWRRMQRLVECAEEKHVKLALENVRQMAMLVQTLEKYTDSQAVGVCFDSGHHLCWNLGIDWLEQYKERIYAVHLSDNDGTYDMHEMPFDGILDWMATIRKITGTCYTGKISLEVKSDSNTRYREWEPGRFIEEAYKRAVLLERI